MNYKCVLAWLSLMCFVTQIRAWNWSDASVLTKALEDVQLGEFVFQGYNIEGDTGKDKSFRLKICKNATENPNLMFGIQNIVDSTDVVDLEINIKGKRLNNVQVTKRTFYCGTQDYFSYYYGQGPYERSIAVYVRDATIKNSIADPHGIMTYPSTNWLCFKT